MSDESPVLERSGDISQIVAEVLPLPPDQEERKKDLSVGFLLKMSSLEGLCWR